jgi:hypothetical protein
MKIYYLTSRSQYLYFGLSTIMLAIFITFFLYVFHADSHIYIYFLGLGLVGIFFTLHKILNEHIIVFEKGIEYHAPGVIFEMDWESSEKISTYWYDGFPTECLMVDNSQIRLKKWSFFFGRNIPTPIEIYSRKTLIPLSCFANNWRDSDLGQQIKQYAPHLFEQENKKSV